MKDFAAMLGEALSTIGEAVTEGLQEAADDLLSDSRDLVPYDQGDLSRSGKVTVEGTEAAVSYDTPYAVIQHEATDFAHQDGRRAHYLSDPLRANTKKYQQHLADKVRDALGG